MCVCVCEFSTQFVFYLFYTHLDRKLQNYNTLYNLNNNKTNKTKEMTRSAESVTDLAGSLGCSV